MSAEFLPPSRSGLLRFCVVVWLLVVVCAGNCQWLTQQVPLRPGWNAVFLHVQPENPACDAVFAGIPIESIWAWNRRFEPIRYVPDADALSSAENGWLTYFPSGSRNPVATTLHAIHGGRPYLVKLGGGAAVRLAVKGRPTAPHGSWYPDSFNLFGAPADPDSPPTAEAFFDASPAHSEARLHALDASGRWAEITSPESFPLSAGQAYWAFCRTPSEYVAPFTVRFEQGDGLDFGRELTDVRLYLCNHTGSRRTVTLTLRESEVPSCSSAPYLAGPVPLSYYRIEHNEIGWVPLDAPLSVDVPPNSEHTLRLAVRRSDMVPFTPPAGPTGRSGVIYAGLLEVADAAGFRYMVPVSSEGRTSYRLDGGELRAEDPRVGLWVGYATVDWVGAPGETPEGGREANMPRGSEFEFRLIVHVDGQLQARLVQQVTLMFQPGQYGPAPDNPDRRVVVEPGRYVLVTDDALLAQYSGAALRDGQEVGRRISTAAYAFPRDGSSRPAVLNMNGTFAPMPDTAFPNQLECSWTLGFDDPLNPFKHVYHPDHDNLNKHFDAPKREGFDIRRSITLRFSDADPERPDDPPEWWDTEIGGYYEEIVHGVHRNDITVTGTFRLERVSRVSSLDDRNRSVVTRLRTR